jgi:acetyltransferase-like isoleucine patch superfamily enzyme
MTKLGFVFYIQQALSALIQWAYGSRHRVSIDSLKLKGVRIGKGTRFFGQVNIDITRPCLVEIGQLCVLTDGVTILTHGYDWAILREVYGEMIGSSGKVTIGDNVFIGTNAILLKGVSIGSNSIIGAGSIVTHTIPANSVAVGNPCQVIMTLEEYYSKRKKEYVSEAKQYAYELYLAKGTIPVIEDFWEEFPLFLRHSDHFGNLPVENQLGSAYEKWKENKPKYSSFKEFLIAADIPLNQSKKKK